MTVIRIVGFVLAVGLLWGACEAIEASTTCRLSTLHGWFGRASRPPTETSSGVTTLMLQCNEPEWFGSVGFKLSSGTVTRARPASPHGDVWLLEATGVDEGQLLLVYTHPLSDYPTETPSFQLSTVIDTLGPAVTSVHTSARVRSSAITVTFTKPVLLSSGDIQTSSGRVMGLQPRLLADSHTFSVTGPATDSFSVSIVDAVDEQGRHVCSLSDASCIDRHIRKVTVRLAEQDLEQRHLAADDDVTKMLQFGDLPIWLSVVAIFGSMIVCAFLVVCSCKMFRRRTDHASLDDVVIPLPVRHSTKAERRAARAAKAESAAKAAKASASKREGHRGSTGSQRFKAISGVSQRTASFSQPRLSLQARVETLNTLSDEDRPVALFDDEGEGSSWSSTSDTHGRRKTSYGGKASRGDSRRGSQPRSGRGSRRGSRNSSPVQSPGHARSMKDVLRTLVPDMGALVGNELPRAASAPRMLGGSADDLRIDPPRGTKSIFKHWSNKALTPKGDKSSNRNNESTRSMSSQRGSARSIHDSSSRRSPVNDNASGRSWGGSERSTRKKSSKPDRSPYKPISISRRLNMDEVAAAAAPPTPNAPALPDASLFGTQSEPTIDWPAQPAHVSRVRSGHGSGTMSEGRWQSAGRLAHHQSGTSSYSALTGVTGSSINGTVSGASAAGSSLV